MLPWRKQTGSRLYFLTFEPATRNGCASNGRAFQFNVDIFWLKDESLERSANLPLHCHSPEFPASLDTLKVSVPPAVKIAAATANLDIF